jgi:GxxExxY protein
VDNQVILEPKAVEHLTKLYKAQILTYLRIRACRIGMLINFSTVSLADGIRRFVA